ncbi:MAG: hypothetical protein HRT44_05885, partial [Bdellovibrionales bacterium]|nr:hypothetical protein [Bdellovibrionales bacterium]
MSDGNITEVQMKGSTNNVFPFPVKPELDQTFLEETPLTDKMILECERLNKLSTYKSEMDWEPIKKLELRANKKPIRGGFMFKTTFKLVNSHSTCQQCLYAFEVDTYGRGCVHDCHYCYAKEQLNSHGYWNNPYPVPVDINSIRKTLYTVFETDKPNKWRNILQSKTPIRIGSMSDSFMWMDQKIQVTKEFLRLLNHYKYPYLIFTRSDLVARDDYLALIDRDLASIQFSLSSTNDKLNRLIEPGAPSAARRLKALKKLNEAGYWTTVRINPLFPIYPDGYFTEPNFETKNTPRFDFFSFDMIEQIADAKVPSLLAGFVRLSPYSLKKMSEAVGIDLKSFFKNGNTKSIKDYHYSDKEIR